MTAQELKSEIAAETASLVQVVEELKALRIDLSDRVPTIREKTAAAAFLAQFYTGIENILKRLSRFHQIELPGGENWHFEMFKRFCPPGQPGLPVLFTDSLARQLGPFRRFRHVVHHGYGFQIEWDRMREGVDQVESVLGEISKRINEHLEHI